MKRIILKGAAGAVLHIILIILALLYAACRFLWPIALVVIALKMIF